MVSNSNQSTKNIFICECKCFTDFQSKLSNWTFGIFRINKCTFGSLNVVEILRKSVECDAFGRTIRMFFGVLFAIENEGAKAVQYAMVSPKKID